jgi:IMP dehydrogenase
MVKAVKRHKLLAAAAVGATDFDRATALNAAGCDIIVVDHAHAHVDGVIAGAKKIKKLIHGQLIVGNIATAEAAAAFVNFADALKVGIGPGSICTTRIVSGCGVPQLSAIMNVVKVARKKNVPVIADGGIKYSGDAVKALAAGASTVMLGSLFAGAKEAPGRLVRKNGQWFKEYRGMGSLGAMQTGRSADRYFQKGSKTIIPEGIEALTPYKGPVKHIVEQLVGGIRSGMGYLGAATIAEIPKAARFIQITNSGLAESHPHSVSINKQAPNYYAR